jgi:hypothetical protein
MTFANAVRNQLARTQNDMSAFKSTTDPVTDLFYKIGAARNSDIIPAFVAAYAVDRNLALRIALWARDIRQGAGERKVFRDIVQYLDRTDRDAAIAVLHKVPELGRWDDLLVVQSPEVKKVAYAQIAEAIERGNGLAAKWMPRKGQEAAELRRYLQMSPKQYRKTLVRLTKVVEQQMCSGDWDNINFSHVPSVASARYKKAFGRHTPKYGEYIQALKTGEKIDGKVAKVNASAIFPHDVLKGRISLNTGYYNRVTTWTQNELDLITAQWAALPNYVGDSKVLPLVDVSGSMTSVVGGKTTALEVSVSLGLYCADKNTGPFKDTFLTFSGRPELVVLNGTINQKIDQMTKSHWEMNTNLHAALDKILEVAGRNGVPQSDMPDTLLILSDMQFDRCTSYDDNAKQMIERKYANAGYAVPKIVFWNLNGTDNVPARSTDNGVALVSGFSPTILKAVLANDLEQFTPRSIMLKTIMNPRYDV